MNLNTPFNREQESMNIFRDYINFCHAEQSSLNNILHTQNTLANNRYSMFSLMFRHIHNESILPAVPPTTWPPHNPFNTHNNLFTRNRFFNNGNNNNITRWPSNLRNNRINQTNTTINPLREFINAAARNDTERRRPATMRHFFENCEVFLYSNDLSNNQIRCPIAMTDFSNNDICVKLPCNHIFKIQSILQWFTRSRSCPLCRRRINANNNGNNSNNVIDLTTENASVQTRDISNGFVADISANSIENLSRALTTTLQNRLQDLLSDPNLSNTPTIVTTNISLIGDQMDHISSTVPPQTSPINNTNTDNSGNIV